MSVVWSVYKKFRYPFKISWHSARYSYYKLRYPFPKILSIEQTIDRLLQDESLSMCRFGDGELHMLEYYNIGFQSHHPLLKEKLLDVLKLKNERCMVCLSQPLSNFNNLRFGAKLFWIYSISQYYSKYRRLLNYDYLYGNTFISRPYIDAKDKSNVGVIFNKLKNLWSGKNVLIVEGEYTRLGVGNDLFDDASQVRRITTLSKNAFSVYDQIKAAIVAAWQPGDVVIMALGPTATVLAYELSAQGIRCMDVGHIDIEYEWFRSGVKKKSNVKGKYVNEVGGFQAGEEKESPAVLAWRQQILQHVG